jgi:hypothetical protein
MVFLLLMTFVACYHMLGVYTGSSLPPKTAPPTFVTCTRRRRPFSVTWEPYCRSDRRRKGQCGGRTATRLAEKSDTDRRRGVPK